MVENYTLQEKWKCVGGYEEGFGRWVEGGGGGGWEGKDLQNEKPNIQRIGLPTSWNLF